MREDENGESVMIWKPSEKGFSRKEWRISSIRVMTGLIRGQNIPLDLAMCIFWRP